MFASLTHGQAGPIVDIMQWVAIVILALGKKWK